MDRSESREFTEDRSEIGKAGEHLPSGCPSCAEGFSTMRSLEMSGSYPLSDEAIDETLARVSPGNFALGYMDGDTFMVCYLGRSDCDVRQRLHEWVDMPSRYDRYAASRKAAWSSRRNGLMPLDAPALGHVGNAESSYTCFAYSYAPSAEAAFEKECRNYDDFGGSGALDNEAPPSKEDVWASPCSGAGQGIPACDHADGLELKPGDGAPEDRLA